MSRNTKACNIEHNVIAKQIVLLLILCSLALRLYQLDQPSLWYDELLQLDIAQDPLTEIIPQLKQHAAMPLDYFIVHGWVQLGRQELWVRLPAVLAGTLAIPVIYQLGRAMFSVRVGLYGATLLTVSSFAISYSQEVRPYALLMLFSLLAFLGVWQSYCTGRVVYWLMAGVGLAGAVLSHYFALLLLIPLGLQVLYKQLTGWEERQIAVHSFCFGLCLTVLTLIVLVVGRPQILYSVGVGFSTVLSEPQSLTEPAIHKPNLGSGPPLELAFLRQMWLMPLAAHHTVGLGLYVGLLWVAMIGLFAGQMGQIGQRGQTTRQKLGNNDAAVVILLGWLILPMGLIFLFLLHRGTFFAVRYILYTLYTPSPRSCC